MGARLGRRPSTGASRLQPAALFKRGGPPPLEAELAPEESGLPPDDLNGGVDVALARPLADRRRPGAERVSSDGSGEAADLSV